MCASNLFAWGSQKVLRRSEEGDKEQRRAGNECVSPWRDDKCLIIHSPGKRI